MDVMTWSFCKLCRLPNKDDIKTRCINGVAATSGNSEAQGISLRLSPQKQTLNVSSGSEARSAPILTVQFGSCIWGQTSLIIQNIIKQESRPLGKRMKRTSFIKICGLMLGIFRLS